MSTRPATPVSEAPPTAEDGAPAPPANGVGDTPTLRFLLRRMQRQSDFPGLSEHIAEISRQLLAPERTSAGELANLILKDYALTTKVLRLVNASFYGPFGGRVSTVSRAIVILGLNQVRAVALSLLLFDHVEDRAQVEALREVAGRAFLAGALGRRLARSLEAVEPEEAFICAMFRTLGRYLVVYYFPEEYAEIQRRRATLRVDESEAAVAVLGVSLEAVGTAVAREWQLPAEIVGSMQALPPGPLAPPSGARDRLWQLAALCNDVTEGLTADDASAEAGAALAALRVRYRQGFDLRDETLRRAVEEALEDLGTYAASSRVAVLSGAPHSERLRRWLRAGDPGRAPEALATEAASAEAGGGSLPGDPEAPYATLLAGLQDVTQAVIDGYPLNDILVMVLETAFRGLALTRVILLIRDPRRGHLAARFGLGRDMVRLLSRLQFAPGDGADPFSLAARELRDVVRPDLTRPGAGEDLPAWYRGLLAPGGLALLPLVLNRVCLGLLYADVDTPGRGLSPTEVGYLGTLRNQAVLAIRQRS